MRVVTRCGRFALLRSEKGFWWSLRSAHRVRWSWDPTTRQWLPKPRHSPTPEAATAGLKWTLDHEQAGDLNQQSSLSVARRITLRRQCAR